MTKPSRTPLHRLNKYSFGSSEACTAIGCRKDWFAQVIKRAPRFAETQKPGTGNRRQFMLIDVYLMRLVHVLSERCSIGPVMAIDIAERACFPARFLDQPEATTNWLRGDETNPESWDDAVAERAVDSPWYLVASRYSSEWRVTTVKQNLLLSDVLSRQGTETVDGKEVKPTAWVIVNMTAELKEADRVLRELFPVPPEDRV